MAKRRNTSTRSRKQDNDETIVDIVEARDSLQDSFEKNKGLILGVIAAVVLAVGGYLFYQYGIMAPKEKAVMESMYKAEYQFSRDSFALALENPGGEAEGFLDIIENYSGTKAANTAKYYAGISYLNLGRFEEAIDYLESYNETGKITPAWKQGALGDAHAELGNFDKALSHYKKAASYEDATSQPFFLNKLGLLLNRQGDKSGALNAFKQISENYPKSREAANAKKFLALLQS